MASKQAPKSSDSSSRLKALTHLDEARAHIGRAQGARTVTRAANVVAAAAATREPSLIALQREAGNAFRSAAALAGKVR